MSRESAARVGSGTIEFVRGILPSGQNGFGDNNAQGIRNGSNVVVINPEDLTSSKFFATSGVAFGVAPVKIWDGNHFLLAHQKAIILQNEGPGIAYIGPNSTSVISPSGFSLAIAAPNNRLELPLMKSTEIWARSDSTSAIRILMY